MDKQVIIENERLVSVKIGTKSNLYMVTESGNGPGDSYFHLTTVDPNGVPEKIEVNIYKKSTTQEPAEAEEPVKYPKLPTKFKKDWLAALRSGEYNQGQGQVCDEYERIGGQKMKEPTFCCIGVGGLVCGYNKDEIGRTGILPSYLTKVPVEFRDSDLITHLVDMNDGRGEYKNNPQSFKQIADWVEINL